LATCIVHRNGQRSGVITHLKIEDFKKSQSSEYDTGEMIIPCLHHKTGTHGIARLVVTHDVEKMLVEYYTITRRRIKLKIFTHANSFFLTNSGSLYNHLYQRKKETLSVGNFKLPRPNEYRFVVKTDTAR